MEKSRRQGVTTHPKNRSQEGVFQGAQELSLKIEIIVYNSFLTKQSMSKS